MSSHLWGDIAASNGNASGDGLRDAVAGNMTPARIEDVQKLARECVAMNYKGC